jgi:2-polyprenyl-6-methoxyphenol hydroxylase-like FAD-dependent oxidoreductase
MILIIGGGIGGLVTALMLHDEGIACEIYEAASEVRELGVGINIMPFAVRKLIRLGLLADLDATGIRTRQLKYANHLGQEIWSELRGLYAGHEAPQFSIHRGRLHTLLWRAARDRLGINALHTGHRFISYVKQGDRVVARFLTTSGIVEEVVGDALIGADGIHSSVRRALHPEDGGIRWNGIRMWRGAREWEMFEGGDSLVIAGDTVAKTVIYPIAIGQTPRVRLTNWVIYARVDDAGQPPPRREDWGQLGDYDDMGRLVGRFNLPFIDLGSLIRGTCEIYEYPMCDRDPLPWWTLGRVTLLGDAAHPMYPVGGNGASQAIIDASYLARCLKTRPVPDALAAYEAERLPATAAIVRLNRTGGPERVVDFIGARAPQGFARLQDVAEEAEVATIVQGYSRISGPNIRGDPQ